LLLKFAKEVSKGAHNIGFRPPLANRVLNPLTATYNGILIGLSLPAVSSLYSQVFSISLVEAISNH
jgi:hypothetical protein